jgi:hypothetical protein
MSRRALALAAVAAVTAACGSISYRLDAEVPAPVTVAVLPIQGPADASLRDAARQLLHSRLVNLGYRCPELEWVDRVLSEQGWMRDPDAFVLAPDRLPTVLAALHADAALVGEHFDESSFNVILLRRHAVGGRVAVRDAQSREWWSSSHGASTFGGFLITSGQVFSELRAQGEHRTAMASLALVDEFVADVVGTIPARPAPAPGAPPAIADVGVDAVPQPDGSRRLVVRARAAARCSLRFDLVPHAHGIPMVAAGDDAQRYRGDYDVPAGAALQRLVVRARDAFGRERTAEAAL